ncbi:hypothetical protein F5884DRAFT_850423 [Xylogone sp. PMI_703]|nr:hypothetical protein F5884DRAFT_850423 [Xylogone sp. PMI_703]
MSRAVDRDIAASVQTGNPQSVYDDIVHALNDTIALGILEIELLGRSHELPEGLNILREENSIAIPKTNLVKAFTIARRIFFTYVQDLSIAKHQELRDSSAIMLLMDPEYLTAANARKRLIEIYRFDATADLEYALQREIIFTDSLLTSPLHRHSKSPTLWDHRRWLQKTRRSASIPIDVQQDLRNTVLVAAERHPRNYYAWSHIRWLVKTTTTENGDEAAKRVAEPGDVTGIRLLDILMNAKEWCLRHPSDISGWSFMLFMLFLKPLPPQPQIISAIFNEVVDLALSLKWVHESVWIFLRTIAASSHALQQDRKRFLEVTTGMGVSNDTAKLVMQSANRWCARYQQEIEQDA